MNAATPLFYETGCEVAYPVAEGVANLVLTLVNNLFGLVFLLIQMIPNIGKYSHLREHVLPKIVKVCNYILQKYP